MLTFDLALSEHDDGYRIRDWFGCVEGEGCSISAFDIALETDWRGTLDVAVADMPSAAAVAALTYLQAHYLGPDVDGVEVTGTIFDQDTGVTVRFDSTTGGSNDLRHERQHVT
jgi:hypothetical protein